MTRRDYLDWMNLKSADEGWALLGEGGWPEGASRIQAMADSIPLPALPSVRRKPRWSDDGDDFDRDRFKAGRDDFWRVAAPESASNGRPKAIRIYVGTGASCSLKGDDYFHTGATACALADALETAGVRTEIIAYSSGWHFSGSSGRGGRHHLTLVTLKSASEPLHLERLAAWTAHPAAFRQAFFSFWYSFDTKASSGLGPHDYDGEKLAPHLQPGDIHIPRARTAYEARSILAGILDRINGSTSSQA